MISDKKGEEVMGDMDNKDKAVKADTIAISALKAEAYDLLTQRGQLIAQVQAIETQINDISARLAEMEQMGGE